MYNTSGKPTCRYEDDVNTNTVQGGGIEVSECRQTLPDAEGDRADVCFGMTVPRLGVDILRLGVDILTLSASASGLLSMCITRAY